MKYARCVAAWAFITTNRKHRTVLLAVRYGFFVSTFTAANVLIQQRGHKEVTKR
jgi:hypothetical protein